MARILDSHLADDTLDNEQAEVIFKEHLRGVYKPNIRSILTVSDNFIILLSFMHRFMLREYTDCKELNPNSIDMVFSG